MRMLLWRYAICAVLIVTATAFAKERIPGDLDGNGKVDLDDFFILAENFGKGDGAVFGVGSLDTVIVRDTTFQVDTLTVVRVVRDTTVQTIRDTVVQVFRDTTVVFETIEQEKPESIITVVPFSWGQSAADIIKMVCESTRGAFSKYLASTLTSDIVIHYEPTGPIVYYGRPPTPIEVSDVAGNKPKAGETWACEVDHRGELLPAGKVVGKAKEKPDR